MLGAGGCNTAEPTAPVQSGTPSLSAPSEYMEQSETPSSTVPAETKQPLPVQTETLPSPVPSVYVESNLENFSIAIASDELLDKYNSYHEYISDERIVRIMIWTDTSIKDFAFISVDHDETGDKITYLAGDILFSLDELTPKKPFVAEIFSPEIFPVNGISFRDENGVKRYFCILSDGRGAEEAPPYFFLEFKNGGDLMPANP